MCVLEWGSRKAGWCHQEEQLRTKGLVTALKHWESWGFSTGSPICSFLTLTLSVLHPSIKALGTHKSKHGMSIPGALPLQR